ncbi:MAG: NTP transferase domain-containing protein [Actinobacteria bacterium]|nr:NTP transferase domain-containing protein [Actinomycetota bacterium]
MADVDAVVLAGGRGSRLGAPSKPDYVLGGRRLLDVALSAVRPARRTVVVGPGPVPDGVLLTREDPPYSGPVEAVAAGLAALPDHAAWTLLLACDLPAAEAGVERLLSVDPGEDVDGVCLVDRDGRLQWLLGCYRTAALQARLADRGDPPLTAMYALLGPLRLLGLEADPHVVQDVDTPEDAQDWVRRLGGHG